MLDVEEYVNNINIARHNAIVFFCDTYTHTLILFQLYSNIFTNMSVEPTM